MKFPEQMSEELAELVGIHFGDGSLYQDRYNYNLTYSGNLSKDSEFIGYINSLFDKLFSLKLKVMVNNERNSITLRIRSKSLFYFFKDKLQIPIGKKENLSIPYWVKTYKLFLAAFLRGLFDTDGWVVLQKFRNYSYVLVKISMKNHNFAKEVSRALTSLNIPSFITIKRGLRNGKMCIGYEVVIRNKNVEKFLKIIGSKNSRNLAKFEEWGCRDLNPNFGS